MDSLIMHANITWQCLRFSELSTTQLYAILKARSEVFVVEQNCVYLDMDGVDPLCQHLVAWTPAQEVAAYLRLVPPGIKFAEASLGRVISSPALRGTGIGKQLLSKALEQLALSYPDQPVRIGAQQYLEKFYQSFGFVTASAMFLEDEIPHIEMLRTSDTQPA
ncbi:GNAT family N-acetyltransferase [Undibacterium parvum]|uniref:GNAT family N-acetyltransferase n=1 Tax=Undibacterium parvum TaxID=401471 RepID=UPI001D131F85|nr:GNAT family N-acetyltransferase [Undibacterium parvum]